MGQTLARSLLELENANYRGTGGVSENNRCMGFQPAFIDRESGTVYLSRFPDGRLAPCQLFDGLPAELVLARDVRGRAVRLAFGRVRVRASRAFLHPRRGGSAACTSRSFARRRVRASAPAASS
jgi:hypothetical protein